MKKATIILFAILLAISSCDIFDKGYESYMEFPILYLNNTSSSTIAVESYYYDKPTMQEQLWKSQNILPGENSVIMDWTFPSRIRISKNSTLLFEYIGSNSQLVESNLNPAIIKISSTEYVFDSAKYIYANIPFDTYDFSWMGTISSTDKLCGKAFYLVYTE